MPYKYTMNRPSKPLIVPCDVKLTKTIVFRGRKRENPSPKYSGRLAEWSNAPVLKTGKELNPSRVRIPDLPPLIK
jgi:hypothetical protein